MGSCGRWRHSSSVRHRSDADWWQNPFVWQRHWRQCRTNRRQIAMGRAGANRKQAKNIPERKWRLFPIAVVTGDTRIDEAESITCPDAANRSNGLRNCKKFKNLGHKSRWTLFRRRAFTWSAYHKKTSLPWSIPLNTIRIRTLLFEMLLWNIAARADVRPDMGSTWNYLEDIIQKPTMISL